MRKLLVTGASGFLGQWTLRALKNNRPGLEIVSLSRQGRAQDLSDRVIKADLSRWNSGLEEDELELLKQEKFDALLHIAGLYDLRADLPDAFVHNVFGTHNALHLAELAEIPVFAHISTVAVTMGHSIKINPLAADATIRRPDFHTAPESEAIEYPVLPNQELRGPFPDNYATTKAEAEKLVRNWSGQFPQRKLILRPGIIIGDSKLGAIHRIDGPYHAIEAIRRLRKFLENWNGPLLLPGHSTRSIPLVPVDFAAEAVAKLLIAFADSTDLAKSYYVAPSNGPTAKALYSSILRHLSLDREVTVTNHLPDALVKPLAEWIVRLPREELDYVINLPELDFSATEAVLGQNFFPTFETIENSIWRGFDGYAQNR